MIGSLNNCFFAWTAAVVLFLQLFVCPWHAWLGAEPTTESKLCHRSAPFRSRGFCVCSFFSERYHTKHMLDNLYWFTFFISTDLFCCTSSYCVGHMIDKTQNTPPHRCRRRRRCRRNIKRYLAKRLFFCRWNMNIIVFLCFCGGVFFSFCIQLSRQSIPSSFLTFCTYIQSFFFSPTAGCGAQTVFSFYSLIAAAVVGKVVMISCILVSHHTAVLLFSLLAKSYTSAACVFVFVLFFFVFLRQVHVPGSSEESSRERNGGRLQLRDGLVGDGQPRTPFPILWG